MNNTYKTNKTDWRRLMRSTLFVALLLGGNVTASAQDATQNGYVFYYSNNQNVYLNSPSSGTGNSQTAGTTTFDPLTCFWTGASGSTLTNGAGYHWYNDNDGNFYVSTSNSSNVTFTSSNGGTVTVSGNSTYPYLGWYSNRFDMRSKSNQAISGLYSATKNTYNAISTDPTISGPSEISALGTAAGTFTRTGEAAYRAAYFNYRFQNADHLFAADNSTTLAAAPANHSFSYTWSLSGISSEYAEINSSTGVVNYKKSTSGIVNATVTLTATSTTDAGVVLTTSQTLTFMPLIDPTSLTLSSGNTMTVYAGQTGNITYSLLPDPCYDNVTFASDATSVATVNASGVVTGVSTGTATITVTAHKLDGTTNASLTKTVTVTVKNKVATPVITLTPDPLDNTKATATITCATPGTTIYYKVNSGAYAEYATGVELDEYDAITAYAVMISNPGNLWDNSDEATETYVSCSTGDPTISYVQSGSTATVTITAEDGATIYYTTDGNNPTSSSTNGTTTVTFNGVATGTTVKAYAKNGTCSQSAIVSMDIVLSGVSGGVVTLNDREDHRWSYYSDATLPAQLRSLNPADVTITYYGNGNNVSTSDDAAPAANTFTASSNNSVAVGIDAPEGTFVYYKTLERENADGTGNCLYTTIPNPFSVRPTYGSGDTRWRGFYAWRVVSVSGGTISGKGVGDTINAESTVSFIPTSEYGMEVKLEALWARMYVNGGYQASVGYERNFVVDGAAVDYPATYSAIYPNGTTNGTTAATMGDITTYNPGNGGRTLSYDTKFEYINLTGNRTYTANNHYLCFGRGISTANNAGTVQGINGGATDLDYTIRVESGTFNQFCFVRDGTNTTVSGRYLIKAIMGSDYDRATGTNNKLIVSPNSTFFLARTVGFTGSSNKDQKTFDCVFKSGTYQSGYWNGTDQSGQNAYLCIAYLGQNSAQGNTYPGVRCVTVEGGEFGGMCGGRGVSSSSNNSTYVNPEVIASDFRIKGGTFHGAVFGGAADNPSIGSRRFIITGGEIQSWIAGGCNGTGSTSGTGATDGDSYIYVGGTALVGGNNPITINDTYGGQVFGAGRGISGRASSVNHSHVAVADEAVVRNGNNNNGNVYGGSYNGTIADVSNVYILGGRVEGSAFGGSYGNGTAIPAANVTMTGGLVTNGVYGGSNSTGTVNNVEIHINGGQVGTSSANANIHGGGYGANTRVSQNVDLTLGEAGQTEPGVTVYGDVYGGSALGLVNGTTATTTYHTNVTLNAGTINGSLYGGGLGNNTTAANVYGPVAVTVNGGTVNATSADGSGAIYGCNNVNGAPQRAVTVDIYGTDPAPAANAYALSRVFGGGNNADYTYSAPVVTVHDDNSCDISIEEVYGGGNQAEVPGTNVTIEAGNIIGAVYGGGRQADVNGNTSVTINGGIIRRVFGGNNISGTISGTISVNVNKTTSCPMKIGQVFGGGNHAASQVGSITVGCTGDLVTPLADGERYGYDQEGIGAVYGGANEANITGDITLNIVSGIVDSVFGGNNAGGTINGDITVNINKNGSAPCVNHWYVGYVFGGGNNAAYSQKTAGHPAVNVQAGLVTHHVFGGGNGASADVTGNPTVTLSGSAQVGGNVYGGGNAAEVSGNTSVRLQD